MIKEEKERDVSPAAVTQCDYWKTPSTVIVEK
jgi:hypothetical protein